MPTSSMLTLAIALKDKLIAEIPALIDEINAEFYPDIPIVPASSIVLGIRTEMIKRNLEDLPAMACGIYVRAQDTDQEYVDFSDGQQEFSKILMPFVIDVYLGANDTQGGADALYIMSHKWALVFDLFVERFASSLGRGYMCDEAPAIDISYVLEFRDGSFRQLVSATGVLKGYE